MNKVINQSGEYVDAIDSPNSHARNKVKYNVTLPKLIKYIRDNKHVPYYDLIVICNNEGIKDSFYFTSLIDSAYYYAAKKS